MIRKFATIPGLRFVAILMTVLMGITVVHGQQSPAQQAPAAQPQTPQQPDQSGSQEASPEETTSSRRKKPLNYKKWTFNAGGGANLPYGTTDKYVRGGGGVAAGGVAGNYGRDFGLSP